jgi:8-oxo-dGTP pyrophosphatase MutT (NUDIX family)
MPSKCDHRSVGLVVKQDRNILIIERKKFPPGFALPAGHLDGDNTVEAAKRELREETGIEALELELSLSQTIPNPCRRGVEAYHRWQVFRVLKWSGELKPSEDEIKSVFWASPQELQALAARTEEFAARHGIEFRYLALLTLTLSEDPEWQASPGLEPVWYYILKQIREI